MFANRSFRRHSARRELVVVVIGAVLAWLVATVAIAQSTDWPVWAILPVTLLFGALVGAVTLATASGPTGGWPGIAGRGAVAVLVGAVVGELAAVVLFAGSIDHSIDAQAARTADSTPAVAQVSADLEGARDARTALDTSIDAARTRRDQALEVARCEYNPSPACPQTRITGVPGSGPETRTANELLADAQRELDNAVGARDRQAPGLDSEIAVAEQTLAHARETAVANADPGLGARLVAMHDYTFSNAGALVLWAVTIAFFALLSLLPLILKLLRGASTDERSEAAHDERDRAELEADTAIAVKRAEVRAAIETMWAEQQLASARLAVQAQNEIDRELHRRRVVEALDAPARVTLEIPSEPVEEEDMYLPIEAEAEAASREALPARVESEDDERRAPLTIPNVTKAAARWIRPLVPPIVARAIDTTTHPLRSARQVFEEVEEISFSFKRTYKATVNSEETAEPAEHEQSVATEFRPRRVESSRATSYGVGDRRRHSELADWEVPRELRARRNPRELPPAK